MKHAYFLATEALAGLLCNARLNHALRPLAGRALDQAGQVRDADSGVAPVASSVSRVDVVGRPPCVETSSSFNRVDMDFDAGIGQNGGSHSVLLIEQVEDDDGASAEQCDCAEADKNGIEQGHSGHLIQKSPPSRRVESEFHNTDPATGRQNEQISTFRCDRSHQGRAGVRCDQADGQHGDAWGNRPGESRESGCDVLAHAVQRTDGIGSAVERSTNSNAAIKFAATSGAAKNPPERTESSSARLMSAPSSADSRCLEVSSSIDSPCSCGGEAGGEESDHCSECADSPAFALRAALLDCSPESGPIDARIPITFSRINATFRRLGCILGLFGAAFGSSCESFFLSLLISKQPRSFEGCFKVAFDKPLAPTLSRREFAHALLKSPLDAGGSLYRAASDESCNPVAALDEFLAQRDFPHSRVCAVADLEQTAMSFCDVKVIHLCLPRFTWRIGLARDGCMNAVLNPSGEDCRPLVDALVADADCGGGGGNSAAEQFNGLCFKHQQLNHSSQ